MCHSVTHLYTSTSTYTLKKRKGQARKACPFFFVL